MKPFMLSTLLEPPETMAFFKPTTELRRLLLLASVAHGEGKSQRELAKRAGISVSVTNQYLATFFAEGWAERLPLNRRDCEYQITIAGSEKANEELLRYVREVFVLYSHAKQEIARHVGARLADHGARSVIVYPAGAVGELIVGVLDELGVPVTAVVDDDRARQGGRLLGHRIEDPRSISGMDADAVLVATYRYRREIVQRSGTLFAEEMKVICL